MSEQLDISRAHGLVALSVGNLEQAIKLLEDTTVPARISINAANSLQLLKSLLAELYWEKQRDNKST